MIQAFRTCRRFLLSSLSIVFLLAGLLLPKAIHAREIPEDVDEPSSPGVLGEVPLFGVQMYWNTGNTVKYFPFLTESNASWLRVPILWVSIEPTNTTPALYNWASVDRAAAAALDTQINVILTIERAPGWAATYPDGPIDKVDISEFTEFMQALVERYDGDGVDDASGSPVVNYFELYNEPDRYCSGGFSWGASGDKYAAMLKAVYPVVKAANANAKVVFGGIAYDNFNAKSCNPNDLADNWPIKGSGFVYEFLDDVLNAGGGSYFDVMNFHFYSAFSPNWIRFPGSNSLSVGLLEKTNYVRQKLQDYGVGDKPIIITEAGHNSNPTPGNNTSQQMQAQFVPVLFSQGMAGKLQILIWWLLYDLTLNDYPFQNGLITIGDPIPEKKLAFDAYKIAVAQLGSARFERTLSPAETGLPLNGFPTMEAYKFRRSTNDRTKEQSLYVAWLNPMWEEANKTPKPLKLPAKRVTIRDIFGTVKSTVLDADDGKTDNMTTVGVTGEPVYIEVAPEDDINFLFLSLVFR